jgi:hypothetical protein
VLRHTAAIAAALVASGCSFSPLAHRIDVGNEPFVLFVGEGIDHHTDLFAIPAGGGAAAQVTFTPLIEAAPTLTPTGDVVAFLRMPDTLATSPRRVVMMNLLSGGEVEATLPANAGTPTALAWSSDASWLFIRTGNGLWRAPAPPRPVTPVQLSGADSAAADSALTLWLGRTRFARAVGCSGGGVCIIGPRNDTTPLAPTGHGAIRWGNDSVAWFEANGEIMVRALGPGIARRLHWHDGPEHPRQASYAAGSPPTTP